MKRLLLLLILLNFYNTGICADTLTVSSPSGKICVKVWMENNLRYCIYDEGKLILYPSQIDMLLANNNSFSIDNSIKSSFLKNEIHQIISTVPEKRIIIPDVYNLLSIVFYQPNKIEFRVYDDGVAYRFLTSFDFLTTCILIF